MSKNLLVISYYSNMPGACQAEWVDDRMFAYIDQGYKISLISATCCFKHTNPQIEHIRVATLSPTGANYEYEENNRRNIGFGKYSWLLKTYLKSMSVAAHLLAKIKIGSGEGRWTWFLSSTIASLFLKNKDYEYIFTTGGPASAHLTGILLGKIKGKKVICEFQDPLSGKDIGRNKLSQKGLKFFEKLIAKYADCVIYCTRNAMIDAREKYSKYAHKIFYVYPGANMDNNETENKDLVKDNKLNITYLGSLYQTRNLDSLMKAIREMIEVDPSVADKIEVNVYGNMNADIKERILNFEYNVIHIHGLVSRQQAMQKAEEADVLLLVQNIDDRSIVTIPFKTYDYLHIGKLILGLIYKNDELEEMLLSHGHLACQADDIDKIKSILNNLLNDYKSCQANIKKSEFTPEFAVNEMQKLMKGYLVH